MKQTLERILNIAQSNGATSNASDRAHGQQERTGLKVLIVGAGIGGLTTAIAMRKQGHEVLVGPEISTLPKESSTDKGT